MVFCNGKVGIVGEMNNSVTILILIDGFLQLEVFIKLDDMILGHNPYFNRWFSAMGQGKNLVKLFSSHNPYFNRWFSAI